MIAVLHVDDDPLDQELTLLKLKRLSDELSFTCLGSVSAALAYLGEHAVDCIISDFQMPGKNGMEFLAELRDRDNDTPFIFLTGQGNERIAAQALRVGASDYFTKDEGFAHYDRLLNAIRNVVRASNLARERRHAEAQYRALFEDSVAGVFQTSLDGEILLANKALLDIFGYDNLEEMRNAFQVYKDPHDRHQFVEALRQHGCVRARETHFTRRDGSSIWAILNASLVGEIIHGTVVDVSEQRIVAHALQASQEKYRRIVETASEGIVVLNKAGIVTFSNDQFARMLGLNLPEIVGMPLRTILFEEDWQDHSAKHSRTLEGGRMTFERRMRHRNGSDLHVQVSTSPIVDPDGEVSDILGLVTDISDRYRAEVALRKSEGQIRAKLNAILLPEGDIGSLEMADILDISSIQSLLTDYYTLTGIPVALIDLAGNVLVGTGWQSICTDFHRIHPLTYRNCIECDTVLSQGVEPGTYKTYECKNHLWDVVTPIVVGGKHVGNLFTGQFFYEDTPRDRELFRRQARQYGFDEAEYLAALDRVPVFSRERIDTAISFYMKLAEMISKLSYSNLKLARSAEELKESETRFQSLFQTMTEGVVLHQLVTAEEGTPVDYVILEANDAARKIIGIDREHLIGKLASEVYECEPAPYLQEYARVTVSGEPYTFETRFEPMEKDFRITAFSPANGRFATIFTDITEQRRQARKQLFVDSIVQNYISKTDPTELLNEIAKSIALFTDFPICTIERYDETAQTMSFIGSWGLPGDRIKSLLVIPVEDSISGRVAEKGSMFVSTDIANHPRHRNDLLRGLNLNTLVALPLATKGKTVGTLSIRHTEKKNLDNDTLETIRYIGANLAQILERLVTEDTLHKREAQLSLAIEGSGFGLWDWHIQTGAVEYNERWAEITGHTLAELAPLSFETWEQLCHPDDLTRSEELLRKHFAGETAAYEIECRMRHKDGRWVWVLDRGKVVEWDSEGKPARMTGTHLDITDRKRQEELLEKRIVALTRPLDQTDGIEFGDLFNLEQIQQLQDEFASATGVASIITHPDGTPITKPSNFCRLCSDVIRASEKGRHNCYRSDAEIGRYHPQGPVIQPCLSGALWDAGASISVGGRHIANWLIGQVRDETQSVERIRGYAREIGVDEEEAEQAFNEVPVMAHDRFTAVANALHTLASQLSTSAYQNVQQARFISERNFAEASLKEREALYSAVVNTSVDGFWIADTKGRILEANEAICRLSGYRREELLQMNIMDLEVDGNREEIERHTRRLIETGGALFERQHRKKDGTVWRVEINATYWPIRGGRFFVFLRDICNRKQSEVLLRTRMQLADLSRSSSLDELIQKALDTAELFTGSSIGFFHFVDPDQENLSLQTWSTNTNRNMCTAEGKGMHYPISQAGVWVECFHARKPVIHNDYASLENRKGLPAGHAPVVRELVVPIVRNGKVVTILGVGNKTSDYTQSDVEVVETISSIIMDVVDAKQLKDKLNLQSQALEAAADGIVITNANGVIQWANRAFCAMTGYSMLETLGNTTNLLRSGLHDKSFYEEMWKTIERGEVWRGELINRRKDGSLYPEEMTITPVPDGKGAISQYVAIKHDISTRRSAQEALAKSEREKSLILSATNESIVYFDAELKIVWANSAACHRYGKSAEELSGVSCHDLNDLLEAPGEICAVQQVLKSGRILNDSMTAANGEIILRRCFPIADDAGSVIGVVVFLQDAGSGTDRVS